MDRCFVISKEFTFDAAHNLPGMPAGHPCANLHGHTYTVRVQLSANELDSRGMVYDFTRFRVIKTALDHKYLNKVLVEDGEELPTTTEMLAQWVWDQVDFLLWNDNCRQRVQLDLVRVSETPSSFCELRLKS